MKDTLWLIAACLIVFGSLALLFPAGRKLLAGILSLLFAALQHLGHFLANQGQAFLKLLWGAHLTVLKNYLPRVRVLPGVGEKTTRRN